MAKIPRKTSRSGPSVQRRVAGREQGAIGRVGRITNDARDTESGRRSRRRRRDSRYGAAATNQGVVLRRWLMLGLGAVGVIICAMLVWTLVRQNHSPSETGGADGRGMGRPENSIPSLGASEATALVSRMLDADAPSELAPILREGAIPPDGALQRLNEIRKQAELSDPTWLGTMDSICAAVDFVALPRSIGKPLIVPLTPGPDEKWRIDFDAMVGRCSPAFGDWVAGKADQGLVRAFGREDNYFNGPFRDDGVWACFVLNHPENDGLIYGYCRRDSPQFNAIAIIQKRNRRAAMTSATKPQTNTRLTFRVTLKLRAPENGVARQYEITEVVADDWVVGETSLEAILRSRGEN